MAHRSIALPLLAAVVLSSCAEPVPVDRMSYVGSWEGSGMYLQIEQDGTVRYRRNSNGTKTAIEAPLKGFVGDDIEVGIGPLATTFAVSTPPQRLPDRWIMVVDGVTLQRVNAAAAAADEDW